MAENTRKLSDFTPVPSWVIKVGEPVPADVYVFLERNQTIARFKKEGDDITQESYDKLAGLNKGSVLILKPDLHKLQTTKGTENLKSSFAGALVNGEIDAALAKEGADSLLQSVNTPLADNASSADLLVNLTTVVEAIMADLQKSPMLKNYTSLLESVSDKTDALSNHNRQVSALAVLFLMSLGEASMDEISDLGTAGLAHDMALADTALVVQKKHLSGDENFNDAERMLHMKHVDGALELLKKKKVGVTPYVMRTVELHHENWDGSGFRGMTGNAIFKLSRVLRVADDAVVQLNREGNRLTLIEILSGFQDKTGKMDLPVYDPEMTAKLISALPS